ncbi:hypothetical protein CEB3_c18580 [Peptococcaceae bacterium CEB3]|nr:hypothetical protein CEB3_c18580 [Peptococcaceae bacterium CEB3]
MGVPTINQNMVGTVDILNNPVVVMVAFLSKYVIAALAGIAIFLGIVNLLKIITHYVRGNKQVMQTNANGGIFGMGGHGFASNPLVVTLAEFLIGIVLIGLVASGAWVNIVNSLMSFGSTSLNGMTLPNAPTNTN